MSSPAAPTSNPPTTADDSILPKNATAPADASARQNYLQAHPEIPADIRQALREGRLAAGMTPEQVTLLWGSPSRIRQLQGISGRREEWIYDNGREAHFQLGLLYDWK